MYRKALVALLTLTVALVAATAVPAKSKPTKPVKASGFSATLFGAAVQEPNDVKLVSDFTDTSTANDFSGITVTPSTSLTFANVKTLSAEFNPTQGGCGGGSPRFQVHLGNGTILWVYFGSPPNYNTCALNTWQSTGNLIGNNDACRYAVAQGTQCLTYSQVLAQYGTQTVTAIDLVVDGGWFFTPKVQTVLVRNVQINGQTLFSTSTGPGNSGQSPAHMCKAQLKLMGVQAFEMLWGSNGNLRNAFGKCVSHMAQQQAQHHGAQAQAQILNAAQTCKSMRKNNPASFRSQFGTGRNALGRCVVAKAHVATPHVVVKTRRVHHKT